MKKIVLLAFVLVLLSTTVVVRFIKPVVAQGTIYIRSDGSVEPEGTPIFSLDNVTYTFTDNINVSIVVERNNIVVDGADYTLLGPDFSGTGIYLWRTSNVTIKNTRIMLFYYGVYLYESSNNTISKNNITQNIYGIWLDYSLNNAISGNNVKDNDYGIYLHESSNNIISGNNMTDNGAGIYLNWSSNNIISGNNMTINQGSIWLSGSSNNTMSGNNATKSMVGIGLGEFSNNNSVSGNNIKDNGVGITLASESSNNSISGNDIENNGDGIWLSNSSNNKFYHNNFVDNTQHVYIKKSGYANFWDNDVEGNYWSNYTGVDSDHDGIGDSPHVLDGNKTDNHPLMGMFHSFNTSLGCYVNVVSNSTIEDFDYFESNSTIRMHVSNSSETQSFGFCRVCISKGLMSLPYTIIIDDGLTEVLYFNDTVHYNITHIWIYFAYEHSTHKVEIIPEFPTWTSMLLILIVLTVAIAICKRRLLKTQIH